MTDVTRDILTQAGVDLVSAKERLMGNERLLLRMLFRIDTEQSWADLVEAFAQKDAQKAVEVTHRLKGLFGNLSVMPLYDLFARQTALLRSGEFSAAEAMLPDVQKKLAELGEALSRAKQAEG